MKVADIVDYIAGDSMEIDFTVQDAAGAALDLSGAVVKWSATKAPGASNIGTAIVTKTIGSGITIMDATAGTLKVLIGKGDIQMIGWLFHDLEVTLPSGLSYTVAYGRINALPAIIRN